MQTIIDYKNCPENAKGCVIALGNFDGVHLGHQQVIKTARDVSKNVSAPSAVLTFEPHPISILKPDIPPFRLSNLESKTAVLKELGVDTLFALPFNIDFSKITAQEFIEDMLVKHLAANHIVIGYDFIFGHNREGNAELLKAASSQFGFGFTQVQPVGNGPDIYSSTKIRQHIFIGNPKGAASMLGRNFTIEGKVIKGDQRGRTLGFPTANIALGEFIRPKYGVYAVKVAIEGKDEKYDAVANMGLRPTFGSKKELLEVYIFNFEHDIYGKHISVELVDFIREEKAFDDIEEIKEAIKHDCTTAKQILKT